MHDIVVIGAGPAGLHAARLLAERGLDVIVLEEHEAVGQPVHCTGIRLGKPSTSSDRYTSLRKNRPRLVDTF